MSVPTKFGENQNVELVGVRKPAASARVQTAASKGLLHGHSGR